MQQYKSVLIYGFAIFAMFFGSGNLVFPLQIGQVTGSHWLIGFLGLFMSGILLPFLGLFVIKLHRGNYHAFFGEAGRFSQFALPLFTLSLLGAFGVVPRSITVAYGGMSYLCPHISLMTFSFLFCTVTFFFCLKDQIMLKVLGKWMCPLLLISLAILIISAVMKAPAQVAGPSLHKAFTEGFLTGYQTMDLFAAFFFSALVFTQIQKTLPASASHKDVIKVALLPSLFGAGLLALVYLGFVYLGDHYYFLTKNTAPEYILPTIAQYTLGSKAVFVIAPAVVLSCLTTAVALNNIYARYLCSLFKISPHKFWLILLSTTTISFFISLLNFHGIAGFLAPILQLSYPGLIALTMLSILFREHKKLKIIVFYGISIFMLAGLQFFQK